MYKLDGKRAVITGAASGLGRSLATVLAAEGWKIGIVDINDAGSEETLGMVERAGGTGEVYRCDVRDADQVMAMADHFFEAWGEVSLLINNAGIAAAGLVGDIEVSEWRRSVDVNLLGVVNGCHAFIPRMKSVGHGYIVNVASAAGFVNLPEMGPYNVTKAAIISLSETLRTELSPYGIGVTVACPTFFNTNLLATMSCTDGFQDEFAHCAFSNSKVTSEDIARNILRRARRGRLYALPQFSAKWNWATKRYSPNTFYSVISLMNRHGVGRPFLMWMARHGMV